MYSKNDIGEIFVVYNREDRTKYVVCWTSEPLSSRKDRMIAWTAALLRDGKELEDRLHKLIAAVGEDNLIWAPWKASIRRADSTKAKKLVEQEYRMELHEEGILVMPKRGDGVNPAPQGLTGPRPPFEWKLSHELLTNWAHSWV